MSSEMAAHGNDATVIVEENQFITMRKKRRNSNGSHISRSNSQTSISRPHAISITPPATPKRAKKRVRFCDPGPEFQSEFASSGLTPFIRRTIISTPPSSRGHSMPGRLFNRIENESPLSGTLQFEPLRQILDSRVKRRLRRNRMSEEVNNIEWDKRQEAKARKTEVERLRSELAAKDIEMQNMRDEQGITNQIEGESGASASSTITLSTKVQELEQQIVELKAELQRKETASPEVHNWTMAARDPFIHNDQDDNMIMNDDDFGTSIMDDEVMTTPTRLKTLFPSPPSSMPNTPCKPSSSVNAGIQTSLPIPDPEKDALRAQLQSLEVEVSKLTAALAFNEDNQTRLSGKLSEFIPTDESNDHSSLDSALDTVLTQLALSQSQALEKSTAFSALSTEISSLGFPSSGPEETISTIAQKFRQARLELEYLTPGEVVEGFENEKLLSMLITRIRVLLQKVKDQDSSIDEYHFQEISLREQLNTKVSALDNVQNQLYLANTVVVSLRSDITEQETSNSRLQSALEGYRAEVSSLEKLIGGIEKEGKEREAKLQDDVKNAESRLQDEILAHDITRSDQEGRDMLRAELQRRLQDALSRTTELHAEIAAHASALASKTAYIQDLEHASAERDREHGDALAARDTMIADLKREIDRGNDALQNAHTTILAVRQGQATLEAQVEAEKKRGEFVVGSMRAQLARVVETGAGYLNGDVAVRGPVQQVESIGSSQAESGGRVVVRRGGLFDAELARKGKKRRRYDGGLGFLEEAEEESLDVQI
ncbi:hypothetical protein B7494_g2977 [Chlorociboria aeruginascens]|nr:hypothetical protein B7494_g2977 [Chlorociboria aeruginascens]